MGHLKDIYKIWRKNGLRYALEYDFMVTITKHPLLAKILMRDKAWTKKISKEYLEYIEETYKPIFMGDNPKEKEMELYKKQLMEHVEDLKKLENMAKEFERLDAKDKKSLEDLERRFGNFEKNGRGVNKNEYM